MAAAGIRFCTLVDNSLGEPEQDANSALTELDKGLKSNRVGEQCEAIVRFPKLFEKYPFPLLVNSSFLKLAEVFRVGNNFVRLQVVKIFQQCEKHLNKIVNIDEFLHRIISVMHSNDPLARGLALRVFGSIASIVSERHELHHSIRSCLDSHNTVEVEAAIFAAEKFASYSKSFAINMCNKISDMIHGLTTPVHMKLRLIQIFQYMYRDTSAAAMVRTICVELLKEYPARDFVLVTLRTLTKLALATLVNIPDQVLLLLQFIQEDPRSTIRIAALKDLYNLAKEGSQRWPGGAVFQLLEIASSTRFENLLSHILDVVIMLTRLPTICQQYYKSDSALMVLCYSSSLSSNPVVAGKSVKIMTQIACYCYKEQLLEDLDESVDCIESYLFMVYGNESDIYKSAISNLVALCQAQHNLCPRFIRLITNQLMHTNSNFSNALICCKALCSISSLEPSITRPLFPKIFEFLRTISEVQEKHISEIKETLCTLIFISSAGWHEVKEMHATVDVVIASSNLWSCYRIARCALRYGNFLICEPIIGRLREHVASEHYYYWMNALQEISIGESKLRKKESKHLLENVNTATTHYHKAISSLKAASTPSFPFSFQIEYVKVRVEMLHSFAALFSTCNGFCLAPPPAVSTTITHHCTRDELSRYGQITIQLRKRSLELRNCGENFWKLYQTAFDADPVSLLNLQSLQYICMYMAHSIESMVYINQVDELVLDSELETGPLEVQLMIKNCAKAKRYKESLCLQPKSVTHAHVDCLVRQGELLLVSAPMCYPRYFFQTLQCTSVALAVTPQPRVSGEHITVHCGNQFAVKVEGILQYKRRPGLFRTVVGVVLTTTCQLTVRANTSIDIKMGDGNTVLTQKVTPQHEFFIAEFLLAFTIGGQYQVTIDAALVDSTGFKWRTGVTNSFSVKAHDETATSRGR